MPEGINRNHRMIKGKRKTRNKNQDTVKQEYQVLVCVHTFGQMDFSTENLGRRLITGT
jgi:hypothetical protein